MKSAIIRAALFTALAFVLWLGCTPRAHAADNRAQGFIPDAARHWQRDYMRICRAVWQQGTESPCATMAAQIHQESTWNCQAKSRVGALGCAQFMPKTAQDFPDEKGLIEPTSLPWAARAQNRYMAQLWRATQGATGCDRMKKTEAQYNGGAGWQHRDERLAVQLGLNPLRWEDLKQANAGRSSINKAENNAYPDRISSIEPRYVEARWGAAACSD